MKLMKSKRKNNFELLRIISMIMILSLHLLRFGGLLDSVKSDSIYFCLCWIIESLCFIAVNVYVILSGYFLINSKFKFSKLIKLWFEVIFYSLSIYAILLFTNNISFEWISFLKSIFPITLGNYWFITVYFLMYLFSPILNKVIKGLSKEQYKYLLFIIILFYSIIPIFVPQGATINYGGSYSISWFICLYLFAGYMRLYDIKFFNKKFNCLLVYFLTAIINFSFLYIFNLISVPLIEPSALYNYYSITVLLGAISLFYYFKNIKIKGKLFNSIISFFAPCTFGVYLIHENPNLRQIFWSNFTKLNEFNVVSVILIFLVPVFLFVILSSIDKLRIVLFDKKISNFSDRLTDKKIIKKIEGEVFDES